MDTDELIDSNDGKLVLTMLVTILILFHPKAELKANSFENIDRRITGHLICERSYQISVVTHLCGIHASHQLIAKLVLAMLEFV